MVNSAILRSEERVINAPKEGERAPNIIQELDALFPSEPPQASFSDLASLAEKVYLR